VTRLVLLCGIMGCRVAPTPDLTATLVRYNSFVRHEQGDSIAALYAPDGELVTPSRSIRGPAAIGAFLATFTNVRVDSTAMWADSVVTTDSGVMQWGQFYQRAIVPDRPPATATGHFVALWREERDGRWLLRRMQAQAGE